MKELRERVEEKKIRGFKNKKCSKRDERRRTREGEKREHAKPSNYAKQLNSNLILQ